MISPRTVSNEQIFHHCEFILLKKTTSTNEVHMRVLSKMLRPLTLLVLLIVAVTVFSAISPTRATPSTTVTVQVVNADGGVYWRSAPDWNTPIRVVRQGVYTGDSVALECYKRGGTVPPYYNNPLWYWAQVVGGYGQGAGWVNDHFLNTGTNLPNIPVAGVSPCVTQLNGPNWGGYAAAGKEFTDAEATWQVTKVACVTGENSMEYTWVGLGGIGPSPLEQIGTLSGCRGGRPQYDVWWEVVDHKLYDTVPKVIADVSVGDVVTAEVQYLGGDQFNLSTTINGMILFSQVVSNSADPSAHNAADFIVEKPENRLSHYDPITFTNISADGQPIDAAPQEMIITVGSPEVELISPLNNGSSFTVTWLRSS